jgi:hypothetical protein
MAVLKNIFRLIGAAVFITVAGAGMNPAPAL